MHLTDEQLNEYLDDETNDRAPIELHLATCEACSARLTALQDLFAEIESLPDVELPPEFAMRFTQSPGVPTKLPRSVTLTVAAQAVLTVVAILLVAPLVMEFIVSYAPDFSIPSFMEMFMQIQSQWTVWLDTLSTLPIPAIPEIPALNVSSLFVLSAIAGVSLLWLVGNGLLLRNQMK
ncbi:MAG TPA: hypothetical protein VFH34_06925 [Anaerolineales bacterium]|nr:hypothetical protein [Anaerolineales bacterium]